jgi:hypothetical protein
MAAALIVTCPECEKKFKPKADVSGKKIKCPFCSEPFVVPAAKASKDGKEAKDDKASPDAVKAGKPKGDGKAAPTVTAAPDDDNDVDPYGVKTVELVPRCPNCTQEMGEHDTICLHCGYNTMTRQWGKTDKILGLSVSKHTLYLLPPVGAAIFIFFSIITLLIYYIVVPYWVADMWMDFIDSEAMRMWITVVFLFIAWAAGMYCFFKFIEKPKPDEVKLD